MLTRARTLIAGYPELAAVLVAVVLGLTVRTPLAWLDDRQGINVLLAVLVFATALTIEPAALRRLSWRLLLAALAAGITVLPALSWAVSRMVAAGSLRDGIMVVGLAPCEIASVATTAMAEGEAAVAAGVLIGSTVLTVAAAGPLLTLEAGHADIHPAHIVATLALVVAAPLVAGIALRARASWPTPHARVSPPTPHARASPPIGRTHAPWSTRVERAASATAVVAVVALVALIAAEVRLSARYLAVAAALIVFLAGSALVGWLAGARTRRPVAIAVLLTTSMRDFAIAAGLAAAAFGPAAAAPLGVYGVMVLIWGTATAGALRRRARATTPGSA